MASIATADIKFFDKHPKGYVIFNIEVYFRGMRWSIERRFNDFVALHHGVSRETRGKNLGEIPKKKFFGRFDNAFLEERSRALQAYLSNALVQISPTTSASMNEFLEVNEHVDISQPQPSYSAVGAEFEAEQEELEERRLAMLVENFGNAMMDSSSVGVEPRGDAEVEAQREKLLRKCNGFSACDEHLKNFFNSPLPNGVEHIGGTHPNTPRYSDGLDGVMESLNGQPIISVQEQFFMSQQAGVGVADQYMQSRIQTGTSLVCHMENM